MTALALDHLVIAAATLEQGVRWFSEHFGVEPGPGGVHPLMGTHNRLCAIGSPAFPRAYLELIAIDPAAPAPRRPRWFGLDEPALAEALRDGPRLVHWVARCGSIVATRERFAAAGMDVGEPIAATRGGLRWQITVRPDGTLGAGGALPTLIEWGEAHPADAMPAGGVALTGLCLRHAPAALAPWLPDGVTPAVGDGPTLEAEFTTPRGALRLASGRAPAP